MAQQFNLPPRISTPREAPWKEVEAIANNLNQVSLQLASLVASLSGKPIDTLITLPPSPPVSGTSPLPVIVPSKPKITTGFQSVQKVGQGINLPALVIPEGYPVSIIASPGNIGVIYLGKSQSDVLDARVRFNGLAPGVAVNLILKNLNAVWMDGTVVTDSVSWIVETD